MTRVRRHGRRARGNLGRPPTEAGARDDREFFRDRSRPVPPSSCRRHLRDSRQVERCSAALHRLRVAEGSVLHGEADAERLDAEGDDHGLGGRLIRALQAISTPSWSTSPSRGPSAGRGLPGRREGQRKQGSAGRQARRRGAARRAECSSTTTPRTTHPVVRRSLSSGRLSRRSCSRSSGRREPRFDGQAEQAG